MPIPGTSIIGALAPNPIRRQPTNEVRIVAMIPASTGIPASAIIDEFTAII
ncbi:hypothetical protein D1872_294990 [compost metagenome]